MMTSKSAQMSQQLGRWGEKAVAIPGADHIMHYIPTQHAPQEAVHRSLPV